MKCSTCSETMVPNDTAPEVYRWGHLSVTVSGIPAVMTCPRCHSAVIEWETAQHIEELVQPILNWANGHRLPSPTVAIAFPERELAEAVVEY